MQTRTFLIAIIAPLGLAACSSSSNNADKTTDKPSAAFCVQAKDLGSLSKGAASAMAMAPADSAKDFQALAAKLQALKANAPATLQSDLDIVIGHFTLESMAESHMKADGTGAESDTQKLDAQKTTDDKAAANLITTVQAGCGVNLT